MAVIQISKIQLRRGLNAQLPGQPTVAGNAATLTPGLDAAELGFALDSGRLFIGSDPVNTPLANVLRTTFPYQNVEIATEYSNVLFNTFYNLFANQFQSFVLAGNVNVATDTGIYVDVATTNTSIVRYSVSLAGKPLQQGTFRIISDGINISWEEDFITLGSSTAYTAIVLNVILEPSNTLYPVQASIQYTNSGYTPATIYYQILAWETD